MAELTNDPAATGEELAARWARPGQKIAGIAGARIGAQVLGLLWFTVAARLLTTREFGLLGSGLALMVVLGGFSDLGTTRSVVRHVAADPARLWPTFVRAMSVRIGAGVIVGVVACATLAIAPVDVPVSVVALAALIAVLSGANEVGYAALRSIGLVRVEVALLMVERMLFTAVACAALALGAGPLVALGTYAATNGLTAVLVTAATWRRRGRVARAAGRLLDAEGRRTAFASSLVIIGPRMSAVLVVLLSTSTAVGSFAIAQKAPEALSLLGIAILTTVLPLLRAHTVARRPELALRAGLRVARAVLAVLLPIVGVIVARPTEVIELLYGSQDRPGSAVASVLLAAAAAGWIVRTLGELLLLAEERAAAYARAVLGGTVVTVVVGIALIPRLGVEGGAWAALIGELTVLIVVAANVPGIAGRRALRTYAVPFALGAGAGATAALVGGEGRVALASTIVVWVLVGAVVARSTLGWLDREHHGVTA